jgi:CelD/BcsL family acetyltransferase involved in cellulose biosynthesis
MRFRLIPLRGISADDERAWLALARRAAEPNPFFEPDCLIPIAQHDPRGDRVHLAVAEEDGRFFAAMPIWDVWHNKPSRVPYPMVNSHVRRMQTLGTPLVDPSAGAAGLAELLEGLSRQRRGNRFRALSIDVTTADGPVAAALRAACARAGFHLSVLDTFERGFLRRRPTPNYDEIRSAKSRADLRRRRRRLSERFGGAEVRLVVRDPSDPDTVAEYVALEAAGYKGRSNVAMTTARGEVAAFTDMCLRMGRDGRARILALEVAGQTVAMQVWLHGGEGVFLTKISYDERYARYTPGVLLAMESLSVFHDQTEGEWVDTCTYEGNEVLLRLFPERRRIEWVIVVLGRNPLDVAAVEMLRALKSWYRRYYAWRHRSAPRRRGSSSDDSERGDRQQPYCQTSAFTNAACS